MENGAGQEGVRIVDIEIVIGKRAYLRTACRHNCIHYRGNDIANCKRARVLQSGIAG